MSDDKTKAKTTTETVTRVETTEQDRSQRSPTEPSPDVGETGPAYLPAAEPYVNARNARTAEHARFNAAGERGGGTAGDTQATVDTRNPVTATTPQSIANQAEAQAGAETSATKTTTTKTTKTTDK